MIIIYYILALIAFLIGVLPLILASFKSKYRKSIPARFFLFNNPKFNEADIHFHACSFGEIRSIAPLLKKFESIAVSVITKTGFDEAKKITPNTRFLPFEIFIPFWLRRSKILVIFEAELWLMLVFWAKFKGSRVILINARISDRSYKRYLKFGFFYKEIFKFIDKVYAQSELDKKRLISLGARDIVVNGNIKSAFLPAVSKNYAKPNERMIVLASTHKGEEELLLNHINLSENDKLILAPRHPERFDEAGEILAKFASKHGFSFERFSKAKNFSAKCVLVDTMGELVNIYAISDIVILGGSFVPNVGGHNPIEAAQFENSIITGEFVFNQKALFEQVGDVVFAKAKDLGEMLKKELKKSKIKSLGSADEIIKDIKDSCERGKSV
ncbi:lipid IV(A) 3-deoxy-D-manno-octulosonic acid transferase [Campylobacter sp. RM16187]|uniref:lipid IV(A) 3-deoxy-D-manno-octulosonic acid transferase n=1 Tax=Campylobacter sp. RM16187 TaxID=1660063 RepID=UPI0021B65FEF|nr:lipid IV(A) 3-deoxy-D-manno-octulosonic acid transferase [Campylobacter sp. RM16187]QKG29650.1 3-deoxy-D-manno-octulosonic-acid transferase (KDO transferase) [Campylobacter sp. RM16187]